MKSWLVELVLQVVLLNQGVRTELPALQADPHKSKKGFTWVHYRRFDFEKGNRHNSLNKHLIKAARQPNFYSEIQCFKSNIFPREVER